MNSSKSLFSGIIVLAIGIILILCNTKITGAGIIILAGILFLLTGLINLFVFVTKKDKDGNPANKGMSLIFGWFVSLAAMILGLCMLVFNSTFGEMIPFIFGLLVFFGAIMQSYIIMFDVRKIINMPAWVWVFPTAMAILAIVIATRTAVTDDSLIMILTGVAMILFGLSSVVLSIMTAPARHEIKEKAKAEETKKEAKVIDVKAKEVSDDK